MGARLKACGRARSQRVSSPGKRRSPGRPDHVEPTAAVQQLQPALKNTQSAVHWNCDLLNAVITRVSTLEVWTNISEPKFVGYDSGFIEVRDCIAATSPKLLELDGFGHAVDKAIAKANKVAVHADGCLRSEIGQATLLIDTATAKTTERFDELSAAHSALEISIRSMQAAAAAAEAAPPQAPGLGADLGRLADVFRRIGDQQRSTEVLQSRAGEVESHVGRHEVVVKNRN